MFTGNSASENGGAVYNDGAQDKAQNAGGVMTITDSLFENNTADRGGAIYNTGTLHFAGTNTFKGNNATEGNDIYNVGSVTVESGVTGLNSGYTQEKGSLAVNSGAALNAAGLELKGGTMVRCRFGCGGGRRSRGFWQRQQPDYQRRFRNGGLG